MLDSLLSNTPLNETQCRDILFKGAVWWQRWGQVKTKRLRDTAQVLQQGDRWFAYVNKAVLQQTIVAPQLVADYVDFSVWIKPKGVLCQGSKWGDHTTIQHWIEHQYRFDGQSRPAMTVHRLDQYTDGLMVMAHNQQATRALHTAFANRQVKKNYQAWVHGSFPEQQQTYRQVLDGKAALTHAWRHTWCPNSGACLVDIQIETGRKHQIRRHLAQAGFPIVGDRLYGRGTEKDRFVDCQLTATRLELPPMPTLHLTQPLIHQWSIPSPVFDCRDGFSAGHHE